MPTATTHPAPVEARVPALEPRPRRRVSWWSALAGAVVVLAAVLLYGQLRGAEQQRDDVTVQRDAAAGRAVAVANPVLDYCSEPSPVGDVLRGDPRNPCGLAEQVIAAPVPPPPRNGTNGAPGRGIVGTDVNNAGHLVVSYTDGTTADVGLVVGRDGAAGRGITGSDIVDGRLVLTYSDGQRIDLGQVVGRAGDNGADGTDGDKGDPGRGVASVDQVDGRLIVSYTDGATQDAGPLPVAPPAEPPPQTAMWCPPGETPRTVSYGVTGPSGTACVTDDPPTG